MFLAKKIIGSLLKPLPLSAIIALIGCYLLLFSRQRRLGQLALSFALIIAIGFSTSLVGNGLLKPLEQQYPPIVNTSHLSSIAYIVVLGGGHQVDVGTPVSSHLNSASTKRLLEGLRLQQQLPNTTLIVSGGAVFGIHREADTMATLIEALGFDKDRLLIESNTRDTAEQAVAIKRLLGDRPFLLVTSAAHMPRSMLLMQQQGLNPIAAPTDFHAVSTNWASPGTYLPSARSLSKSESAIHEYLGQWWAKLNSQF